MTAEIKGLLIKNKANALKLKLIELKLLLPVFLNIWTAGAPSTLKLVTL